MIVVLSARRSGTHFTLRALNALDAPQYRVVPDDFHGVCRCHANGFDRDLHPSAKIVIPMRHPEKVMQSWVNRGAELHNFYASWELIDSLIPESFLFDLERKNFDGLEQYTGIKVDRDTSVIGHKNDDGHTMQGEIDQEMLGRIMRLPNIREFF